MAKIVSEKREPIARPSTSLPHRNDNNAEAPSPPLVSLLGALLTGFFLLGAAAMVFFAFQN